MATRWLSLRSRPRGPFRLVLLGVALGAAACNGSTGLPLPPAMPGAPCLCDPTSSNPNSCMQAYANPQICPDLGVVSFCSRFAGSLSDTDILISNRGLSGLRIDSVSLLGDDNCSFGTPQLSFKTTTDAGQDASIIGFMRQEAIHLTYRPHRLGTDFAVLRIQSNAENFKQLDIAVCGQGVAADAGVQGGADGGICLACMKARSETPACGNPDGGP